MSTKENLHGGHRDRMIEKFYSAPNVMPDHEILEMILFYAIPRVDTNPIAHRLLKTFGSLKGVFKATPEELTSVDGIGIKAASFLLLFGQVVERTKNQTDPLAEINQFSYQSSKDNLIAYFRRFREEQFVALLLDKHYKLISYVQFCDHAKTNVTAEIPELTLALALHKPHYVVIAHNHPSGKVLPSRDDDAATAKINAICSIAGITLLDHVICTTNDAHSYHYDGTLDKLKKQYDITKFFNRL